jgi:CCR4-NOT transcription complex subunit 2
LGQNGVGIEPEYHLPTCYRVPVSGGPGVLASKLAHLSDETLFYMFYAMPRDSMQELAAAELYARNWRFHKDLRLWLTKDNSPEAAAAAALHPAVFTKTAHYERGIFVFFDVTTWDKARKEFTLYYDALEDRLPNITSSPVTPTASNSKGEGESTSPLGTPIPSISRDSMLMFRINQQKSQGNSPSLNLPR